MIDKNRVMLMTKAAMAEKHDARQRRPAIGFYPEDYVGLKVFQGFLGITVLFALILLGVAAAYADEWMTWTIAQLVNECFRILVIYLFVLTATVIILIGVYSFRYYQSKTRMKEEEYYLKKIEREYSTNDRKRGN